MMWEFCCSQRGAPAGWGRWLAGRGASEARTRPHLGCVCVGADAAARLDPKRQPVGAVKGPVAVLVAAAAGEEEAAAGRNGGARGRGAGRRDLWSGSKRQVRLRARRAEGGGRGPAASWLGFVRIGSARGDNWQDASARRRPRRKQGRVNGSTAVRRPHLRRTARRISEVAAADGGGRGVTCGSGTLQSRLAQRCKMPPRHRPLRSLHPGRTRCRPPGAGLAKASLPPRSCPPPRTHLALYDCQDHPAFVPPE